MTDKTTQYGETLNLPQTDFPMRAGLPKQEPAWLERWKKEDIYGRLRQDRAGREKFVLHLGPPYANGNLHVGHALSYVLKDFVVRAKSMNGYDAPYVPGWDCHGLPIEWKVEQGLREKSKGKDDLSVKEIRDLCREEAKKWIAVQSKEWQRFGCIGDWDNPYLTMNAQNEADIVREIGKMMTAGYLYKGAKSVMWSTVEQTALAEAEVEYQDKESTAVYVKFPVIDEENTSVVIWTTTPWTLPANKAVAYGKDVEYVCLKVGDVHEKATAQTGEFLWIAKDLVEDVCKMCGIESHEIVRTEKGEKAAGIKLRHPFYDMEVPMLEGFHVTTDTGTGFVHIAPSHGAEDFQIGLAEDLDVMCHVNGDGTYDDDVLPLEKTGEALTGKDIWKAQKLIIDEMTARGVLLRWYKVTHSYPVSWRSKAPLIFRATPQWFVRMDGETKLRDKALKAIKDVRWVPAYGENRITGMIANRPDWCISRQRAWGVPITIFRNKKTGEYIDDPDVFEVIAVKIEALSIDAWETLPVAELLPEGWLEKNNLSADDLEKETDILDVWIDSGTSHAHVVRRRPELARGQDRRPADLYLEGSDQHRGWFHSSLLTSVAVYNDAPYDQVLTHGFTVDGEGHKMSKSVGNVVAPSTLIEKFGMDIVRLWVASSDYAEDVRLSDEIIKGTVDVYRRFRNTFRYLLGNAYDFDEHRDAVAYEELPELEKYILQRFHEVLTQALEDYENYAYHKVYHALHNFCAVELSSLYFDVRKDALYCDAKDAPRRRSVQTVLAMLLRGLTTYLAPIMPFTTDEVWHAAFGEKTDSVHLGMFFKPRKQWQNGDLEQRWQRVLEIRRQAMLELEKLRESKEIGSSLEAVVTLPVPQDLAVLPWADILIVSNVTTVAEDKKLEVGKAPFDKCPRCWTRTDDIGANPHHTDVCRRCGDAMEKNNMASAAA